MSGCHKNNLYPVSTVLTVLIAETVKTVVTKETVGTVKTIYRNCKGNSIGSRDCKD